MVGDHGGFTQPDSSFVPHEELAVGDLRPKVKFFQPKAVGRSKLCKSSLEVRCFVGRRA
jgi:hypothetical protein